MKKTHGYGENWVGGNRILHSHEINTITVPHHALREMAIATVGFSLEVAHHTAERLGDFLNGHTVQVEQIALPISTDILI